MLIEKIAARGGAKHLLGMWKRALKPIDRRKRGWYRLTEHKGGPESRKTMLAQALKSTRRAAKRTVEKHPKKAIAAAGILPLAAALGAGAIGAAKSKKKPKSATQGKSIPVTPSSITSPTMGKNPNLKKIPKPIQQWRTISG